MALFFIYPNFDARSRGMRPAGNAALLRRQFEGRILQPFAGLRIAESDGPTSYFADAIAQGGLRGFGKRDSPGGQLDLAAGKLAANEVKRQHLHGPGASGCLPLEFAGTVGDVRLKLEQFGAFHFQLHFERPGRVVDEIEKCLVPAGQSAHH